MSNRFYTLIIFLFSSSLIFAQSKDTLPSEIAHYVLPAYEILDYATGDLNLDQKEDLILILKLKDEPDIHERPLLIFLQSANGYQFFTRNDQVVADKNCGDMYSGECYQNVIIKNGYFSVEHYSSKNEEEWLLNTTFKYDQKQKQLFLHKIGEVGSSSSNIQADHQEADSVLTTKDFGLLTFESYSMYDYVLPTAIQSYILPSYEVLDCTYGDLNLDGQKDILVILDSENEITTSLLIFLRSNNDFQLISQNNQAVSSDYYTNAIIKDGYFSIEHHNEEEWLLNTTFKYDPAQKQIFLSRIGEVSASALAADPDQITADRVLTTKNFGTLNLESFSLYDVDILGRDYFEVGN